MDVITLVQIIKQIIRFIIMRQILTQSLMDHVIDSVPCVIFLDMRWKPSVIRAMSVSINLVHWVQSLNIDWIIWLTNILNLIQFPIVCFNQIPVALNVRIGHFINLLRSYLIQFKIIKLSKLSNETNLSYHHQNLWPEFMYIYFMIKYSQHRFRLI